MVSSGHLGGVLSLWNQYESHMEEINGTRLGWGSGDSPAFCPAQGPVLAHIPGSNLSKLASISSHSQEGDDSMTPPPHASSTMPSRYARILDVLHLHLAAATLGRPGCLWLEDSMIQVRCKSALPSRAHHNDIPFPEEHEPDIHQFPPPLCTPLFWSLEQSFPWGVYLPASGMPVLTPWILPHAQLP